MIFRKGPIATSDEPRRTFALYVRNFIFGVEDALVSTVGLLSGIATAGVPRFTIVLTGIILIFIEAFSMAAGSFLSEHSVEDYLNHNEASPKRSMLGGLIMFFSYFVAGFIPLIPYIIIDARYAFRFSIILSLITLFILGVFSARISRQTILKHAFQMLIIGGIAIGIGVIIGGLVATDTNF